MSQENDSEENRETDLGQGESNPEPLRREIKGKINK